MSKKLTIDFAQNTARVPASMKQRIMLGETIETVEVRLLKTNSQNTLIFKRESDEYFNNLTEDIRKRGILVPLLVKRDNTLLAGHNRLEIAKKIGLKYVPVQYVQDDLTPEAEQEFLIKDNLFRRQFSGEEWIEIYRRLVPEYDSIITRDGRGGDRKSTDGNKKNIKKDTVLFDIETATQEDLINYLHKETGAAVETIRKRIQRDKQRTANTVPRRQIPSPENPQKKFSVEDEEAVNTKALKNIDRALQHIEQMNEQTRKEVIKKLKAFVKKFS
jgi:ParB-like chromosome segregation protein Spo0J